MLLTNYMYMERSHAKINKVKLFLLVREAMWKTIIKEDFTKACNNFAPSQALEKIGLGAEWPIEAWKEKWWDIISHQRGYFFITFRSIYPTYVLWEVYLSHRYFRNTRGIIWTKDGKLCFITLSPKKQEIFILAERNTKYTQPIQAFIGTFL